MSILSFYKLLASVQITHFENLRIGRNESVTCSIKFTVDVIEWLNDNGETVVNGTNTRHLNLTFTPVNTSIHNGVYTCRASRNGSAMKTVMFSVSGDNNIYNSI